MVSLQRVSRDIPDPRSRDCSDGGLSLCAGKISERLRGDEESRWPAESDGGGRGAEDPEGVPHHGRGDRGTLGVVSRLLRSEEEAPAPVETALSNFERRGYQPLRQWDTILRYSTFLV